MEDVRLATWIVAAAACSVPACNFTPLDEPAVKAVDAPADTPLPGRCVPIGHDEDGDQIDDACDRCPLDAAPTSAEADADADGDGIGDACDPHRTEPVDALHVFFSFAGPTARARWKFATDRWTWSEDLLRFADVDPDSYQVASDTQPGTGGPYMIVAQVVVDTVPADRGQIGLLANVAGEDLNGLTCAIKRATGGTYVLAYDKPEGGAEISATELIAPMTAGTRYRLQLAFDPVTLVATCQVGDGPAASITLAAVPARGPLGFEALAIAARVESAVIYKRLGAP